MRGWVARDHQIAKQDLLVNESMCYFSPLEHLITSPFLAFERVPSDLYEDLAFFQQTIRVDAPNQRWGVINHDPSFLFDALILDKLNTEQQLTE